MKGDWGDGAQGDGNIALSDRRGREEGDKRDCRQWCVKR
jgi:hypothetical protein